VVVTHDREVATRANRQIVMKDGLIVSVPSSPAAGS
jgi:predicted ABC-type transport system involved in lysophospholipase L1 biosynthesis ATPase subunit